MAGNTPPHEDPVSPPAPPYETAERGAGAPPRRSGPPGPYYRIRVAVVVLVAALTVSLGSLSREEATRRAAAEPDLPDVDIAVGEVMARGMLAGAQSGAPPSEATDKEYALVENRLLAAGGQGRQGLSGATRLAAVQLLRGQADRARESLLEATGDASGRSAALAAALEAQPSEVALREGIRVAGGLRPTWACRAFLLHLYRVAGDDAALAAQQQQARDEAQAVLALLALPLLFGIVGCWTGAIVLLPAYGAVRLAQKRRPAMPVPGPPYPHVPAAATLPQAAATPQLGGLPAAVAPVAARWSLLEAAEGVAIFFVGQAAASWVWGALAAVLQATIGVELGDVASLVAGFVGGGLAAWGWIRWRSAPMGADAHAALGTCPIAWWRSITWGLGGYCAAAPLMLVAGVAAQRLIGEGRSVNPVIDVTRGVSCPVEYVALFVGVAAGAALFEELLFRGFVFAGLRVRYGSTVAIVATALLFMAVHFDPYVSAQLFVLGLVLGHVRERTGSVYPCMVVHALQNGLQLLMMMAAAV